VKQALTLVDYNDSIIRVAITSENGEAEYLQLDLEGLPPAGAGRQAAIEDAIQRYFTERTFRDQHKALTARIAELKAKTDVLAAKAAETETHSSPPFLAELLIAHLAPKNSAQAQLGDLQEMFEKNVARIGERQARLKYWIEVARSFGPLLWQWLKRVGLFTVLIDYFRSKLGL
jgi:hypothetical protein